MKSLYEILEEKDRLRILAKEIDKDDEVTEEGLTFLSTSYIYILPYEVL